MCGILSFTFYPLINLGMLILDYLKKANFVGIAQ